MLTVNRLNRLGGLHDSLWNFFEDIELHPSYYQETEDGYELKLNLAGFKRENINAGFEDGLLRVNAEQGDRKFSQSFKVPEKADVSAVVGRYEDGILYLKINKIASAKPVKIQIN